MCGEHCYVVGFFFLFSPICKCGIVSLVGFLPSSSIWMFRLFLCGFARVIFRVSPMRVLGVFETGLRKIALLIMLRRMENKTQILAVMIAFSL